jgi:NAD(P)H-nitrite reductase large subunit
VRRRLRRLELFANAMAEMSLPRPGLARLAQPDTVVCRCEDVTAREIAECIGQGYRLLDSVKRITRAGMGYCQGRTCAPHIAALVAEVEAGAPEAAGWLRPRPPLRPVPLEAFAPPEDEPAARTPDVAAGR